MRVYPRLIMLVCFLAAPAIARAQTDPVAGCAISGPASLSCRREFNRWERGELKWRQWVRQWGNFTAVDRNSGFLPRPRRPAVPAWLMLYCRSAADPGGIKECVQVQEALEYDWFSHYEPSQVKYSVRWALHSSAETSQMKEWLLQSIHYDGLWTNSSNNSRSYGFFGIHLTLARAGRIYFWGPPGFIILMDPTGQMRFLRSWGVDVYLGNPKAPIINRPLKIYLSFAKVFVSGSQAASVDSAPDLGQDMVGLSITIK